MYLSTEIATKVKTLTQTDMMEIYPPTLHHTNPETLSHSQGTMQDIVMKQSSINPCQDKPST